MTTPTFSFTYNGDRLTFDRAGKFEIDQTLTVTAVQTDYEGFNAALWTVWFENPSNRPSGIIEDVLDCDGLIPLPLTPEPRPGHTPVPGDTCVTSMKGCVDGRFYSYDNVISATEFTYSDDYLLKSRKKMTYSCERGRSSSGQMPFFKLSAKGEGAFFAIGWTGRWQAEFSLAEGGIHAQSGLATKTQFFLQAGEKVRTSSTLIMRYGKEEDGDNKFRNLLKTHFSHKANHPAAREGIFAYEVWGGLTSEEMKKRVGELSAHGVPFEDLWIDAGWYGDCTNCQEPFTGDWGAFAGDYRFNEKVHPLHMEDVKKAAEDAGMHIMLWFEPERATRHIDLPKEHPDWYLTDGHGGHDYIINYGNEEAYNYTLNLLTTEIARLNMRCYRQDYNTGMLTAYCELTDGENRKGITEIKHIMGLYRLWDALLSRFPDLIIDNCASGGRRIDIETLSRSIPFFRSDYQCEFNSHADVMQTHGSNISRWLPYSGCTTKVKRDTYNIRSSYSSSFGAAYYNAIFQSMDEEDFAWAKQTAEEYLAIRRYFSCNFYNHGTATFDQTAWAIWQYHDEESGKGIVMAFRREQSPFSQATVTLKGVKEGATLSISDRDTGATFQSGSTVTITLPQKRSCLVWEYEEQ